MAALVFVSCAAIFAFSEALERTLLAGEDFRLVQRLHALRGIVSTLAASGGVAWYLTRRPSVLNAAIGSILPLERAGHGVDWLIQLRWLAVLGAATAVFLAREVLGLVPQEVSVPLWLGIGGLALANALFIAVRDRAGSAQAFLLAQIATDLVFLTILLHFSGGLENPLFVLYAFHVILAGVLLSRPAAFGVTGLVAALFLGLAFGEYSGLLEHYTLTVFPHEHPGGGTLAHASHQLPFVLALSGSFAVLVSGAVFFTTAIMGRLRQSQGALLRSERLSALGQVVAYIAHEVNNPVGIIAARAKMARSAAPAYRTPEFARESWEIVDRQAERVAQVVRTLLGLCKPRASVQAEIDLNRAVAEALFIAKGRLGPAGIRLESSFSPSLPPVMARHNDLVHVFLNLIHNAIDAMPRGGTLKVETGSSGGWVEAAISDTGVGIPRGDLERIFEPFFTTKRRDGGTGLGLPLSLGLVRSFGGEIRPESVLGRGSLFRVRLPAGQPGADDEA